MASSNSLSERADSASTDNECKPKRPRSENPCCQVCGNMAANFSCSAFVCEACKKFFLRATKGNKSYVCTKGGGCEIGKSDRARCPACRYKKCFDTGMLPPGQNLIDVTKIYSLKCKICERAASGFHYGTLTCEGCRIFFGRLIKSSKMEDLACLNANACKTSTERILTCRACRYNRCVENGMSPDAKRVGRQPNSVKHERFLENKAAFTAYTSPSKIPQNHSEADRAFKRIYKDSAAAEVKEDELSSPDFRFIPDQSEFEEKSSAVGEAEELKETEEIRVSSTTADHSDDIAFLPQCQGDHSSCANTLELLKNDYLTFQSTVYELEELILKLEGKMRKEHILELILTSLRAMVSSQVTFLKRIPGFNDIGMEDRITITKNALFKNALLLMAYSYDLNTNIPSLFTMKAGSKTCNLMLEVLPDFAITQRHFARCGKLIQQSKLEPEEFALLTALNSFDPAVHPQIRDQSSFCSIHNRYMSLLGCYLRGSSSSPFIRFTELVNILHNCSESRNEHAVVAKQFITNYMETCIQTQSELASLAEMFKDLYLHD